MFPVKIGKRRKGKLTLDSRKILTSVSYLVVFMGVVSFVSSTTANVSTPLGVITSESMTPILNVGDIVFIQPVSPFEIAGRVVRHTEQGFAIAYKNLDADVERLVDDAAAIVSAPEPEA